MNLGTKAVLYSLSFVFIFIFPHSGKREEIEVCHSLRAPRECFILPRQLERALALRLARYRLLTHEEITLRRVLFSDLEHFLFLFLEPDLHLLLRWFVFVAPVLVFLAHRYRV